VQAGIIIFPDIGPGGGRFGDLGRSGLAGPVLGPTCCLEKGKPGGDQDGKQVPFSGKTIPHVSLALKSYHIEEVCQRSFSRS